jgi:CubicO group peptidase (beta-lactamase class C family)
LAASLETAVRPAVERASSDSRLPGLVVAVARGSREPEYLVSGADAAGRPLAPHSLFVVASITKLATALAVLRLADQDKLRIDDPLEKYLPDAAAARPGVTLGALLSHTSGLPYDLSKESAPYEPALDWKRLAEACLATPLEAAPFTRVQYSNPGYGLLAIVVKRLTGQPFRQAVGTLVLEPLQIEGYLGVEPPRPVAAIADVRGSHRGTQLEPFNSAFWRSLGLPWAGLLTTVDGVLRLVRAFQDFPAGFLRPETTAAATRNQAGTLGGGQVAPLIWPSCPWGLGPELRDEKTPHWAPPEASPESFGHAGASGCLAWADPSRELAWVIVGTRTADGGWLVRHGPAISAAILTAPFSS